MPFATTHILITIILVELYRDFFIKDNKKFPRYYILIAAIGAIIPDLDVVLFLVLSSFGFTIQQLHRMFSHTIFVPLILIILGIFAQELKLKNKEFGKRHITLPMTFYILAFGSLIHLILDSTIAGAIMPLYPFNTYSIGLNLVELFPIAWQELVLPGLDAALLLFWISWMEFKLKISNYF
jgi:membrane-bound metal-dependent hydrolase YbcI (DUF457 family)